MSILADFYTPDIIDDPKYKLSPSGLYHAPPKGEYEDYTDFIKVSNSNKIKNLSTLCIFFKNIVFKRLVRRNLNIL